MWYLIGGSIIFAIAAVTVTITLISISRNGKNERLREQYEKTRQENLEKIKQEKEDKLKTNKAKCETCGAIYFYNDIKKCPYCNK